MAEVYHENEVENTHVVSQAMEGMYVRTIPANLGRTVVIFHHS